MEDLVAAELVALGATDPVPGRAAVRIDGDLELAYRICLGSRVAQRVLWPVGRYPVDRPEDLTAGALEVPWEEHLDPASTFAVRYTGSCPGVVNTGYGALVVKDAVCDRLRTRTGRRPSVDRQDADLRLHVHAWDGEAEVSVDLSGESLHRRGYRPPGAAAPLKENLAAALLLIAGWEEAAADGRPFVDPMCGSGTLVVEAALLAAGAAPGLLRRHWGFEGWLGHDPQAWERALKATRAVDARSQRSGPVAWGFDADPRAMKLAERSARAAGVAHLVRLERRDLTDCEAPAAGGTLVVNPPYGHRLGDTATLPSLYSTLGEVLRTRFGGWTAHVLAAERELTAWLGLRSARKRVIHNGPIECRLLTYPVRESRPEERPESAFANRLRKRLRHLRRWASRGDVTCYRVYDADLPDYAVAVDRYEDRVHVQEYAPPATVDERRAQSRLAEVLRVAPEVLDVPRDHVVLKRRARQRGRSQYERQGEGGDLLEVREGGHRFLVNLTDYLDTGLFLDGRDLRALVAESSRGKRVLNLFAYTATATVYAARAGARTTTSVDLSRTYLEWARRNLDLNEVGGDRHRIVRADCLRWLPEQRGRWDLVLLDPPTFSNSKSSEGLFDIQRNYVELLSGLLRLMSPGGVIYFSTNFRRFKFDESALPGCKIR